MEEEQAALHHMMLHMQVEVSRRLLGIAVDRLGGTLSVSGDELDNYDTSRLDVVVDHETESATVRTLPSVDLVIGDEERAS